MRVNFDSYDGIIRSVKTNGWNYQFKEAGSNPVLDPDRDKIKSCTGPVPEKFSDSCKALVIRKMGNGYRCYLSTRPGKSGCDFNEKGYEFSNSWNGLHEAMKKHNILIPSNTQIEVLEDFVSRVNGCEIDLRKYEDIMELERY